MLCLGPWGGPRGVGVFLWARYPCIAILWTEDPKRRSGIFWIIVSDLTINSRYMYVVHAMPILQTICRHEQSCPLGRQLIDFHPPPSEADENQPASPTRTFFLLKAESSASYKLAFRLIRKLVSMPLHPVSQPHRLLPSPLSRSPSRYSVPLTPRPSRP